MTGAGQLNRVFAFQKRGDGDDGFGTVPGAGPFATVFSAHCRFVVRSGDEIVINNVPRGVRTAEITTRSHAGSKAVNTTWQAVDSSGAIFAIRLVKPTEKGDFITFTVEEGKP
jgi:hypothetical protein